jgi:hypothetical protein
VSLLESSGDLSKFTPFGREILGQINHNNLGIGPVGRPINNQNQKYEQKWGKELIFQPESQWGDALGSDQNFDDGLGDQNISQKIGDLTGANFQSPESIHESLTNNGGIFSADAVRVSANLGGYYSAENTYKTNSCKEDHYHQSWEKKPSSEATKVAVPWSNH